MFSIQLKKVPPILVDTSLLHQIKIAVKSRIKSIAKSHGKIKKYQTLENVIKRVMSRVVTMSLKIPYTIFCHMRYQMTKL